MISLETIIELFTTLLAIGKPQAMQSSEGRYFELAVEELMRAVLVMLWLAAENISILSIHKVITSLPTFPQQIETEEWQKSFSGELMGKLKERQSSFTKSQWDDLDNATEFALKQWPAHHPETRSNVLSTWTGMASKFTYDPLRRMFCSGRFDFTPEQTTHDHKIVILDIPALEVGREISRLCQVMVKIVFQRGWLRHLYKPGCCHGAFLFQDEFAYLMHRHENLFHSICRGSAIAPVCIATNILGIAAEEFGETKPGSRTLGFLGNLSVKIFHAQTDIETCEYAANTIGREWAYVDNYSAGEGQTGRAHGSVGASRQLIHIVDPLAFTMLARPDHQNPYAEAIVYAGGRPFNATISERNPKGRNFLRVLFSREI